MPEAARTILLVEDNPDDVAVIKRAFRSTFSTRQVLHAETGDEALDYLFARGAHHGRDAGMPEIVFVDLNLPGMSGLEVVRRMRTDERTRRITIVVMTATREDEEILSCFNQGANFFIRKLVDSYQFTYEVEQLERHWRAHGVPR
jgi:two-component system response regulator